MSANLFFALVRKLPVMVRVFIICCIRAKVKVKF